jgi:hypothetical protein
MRIRIAYVITAAALVLAGASARAGGQAATAKKIISPDEQYAVLAGNLQRSGWNFDQIFAELCKTVLSNCDRNPKLPLDDQARAMFGGLWLWTRKGGSPVLQGQNDKALHFIGGGAFQGYWDVGRSAAIIKEEIDKRDPNNFFDLDDMAATMMGARWVDIATSENLQQNRRWLELWATGRYTLSRSLPKLAFGHMEPGKNASPERIKAVRDAVNAALTPPSSELSAATPPVAGPR